MNDAAEVRERTRAAVALESRVTDLRSRRCAEHRHRHVDRIRFVDVDRARKVGALHELIGDADENVVRDAVLDAEARLLRFWILEVFVEDENRRLRKRDAGRDRRIDVRIRRNQRAGERQRLHVDAVIRMRGADHDRRRAAVVNAVAAAHDRAIRRVRRPREADARSDVVVIFRHFARVDSGSEELRVRIQNIRLRDLLEVVTKTGVDGQRRLHVPLVLHEHAVLGHVGMRCRSGSSGAGERLGVARGDSVLEIRERRE